MPHFLLSYELAPDYLERRGAFRDAHLALAWESVECGALLLGGAVGDPAESALLLFNDADAARAFAEADPYVSEGLVRSWRVLPWTTVVGRDAATPVHPSVARSLAHVALVVRDYDEAIAWFTGKLGFELVADECQAEQDKRWVLVAPSGAGGTSLLLARAATPDQQAFVGNQSGGRVFLFLRTDDFGRDFEAMRTKGIRFVRPPKQAAYGTVAVFEDLYGNLWDLVQFAPAAVGDAVPAEAPRSSRMVPQFRVGDMAAAVDFYTRILDFELPPGESVEDPVLSLVRGGVELMLTSLPGDQAERSNAHLIVDDADALFDHWRSRGLDQSDHTESPVHLGPVDQSWGTREFYVTDPSGNTLRVVQRRLPSFRP